MLRPKFFGDINQKSASSLPSGNLTSNKANSSVDELPRFINKHQAAYLIGRSTETLKKYRLSGLLIEGIHWIPINQRSILFNRELLLDWVQNCHDPKAHQRAVETYLSNLACNQPKARGRKPKKRGVA